VVAANPGQVIGGAKICVLAGLRSVRAEAKLKESLHVDVGQRRFRRLGIDVEAIGRRLHNLLRLNSCIVKAEVGDRKVVQQARIKGVGVVGGKELEVLGIILSKAGQCPAIKRQRFSGRTGLKDGRGPQRIFLREGVVQTHNALVVRALV
jgi:hypothetical protein